MAGDIVRNLGGVTYRMSGLADLETALNELSADLRRKVVLAGLRDASKPVVKAARAFAQPRDFSSKRRIAGTMRKAITAFKSKRYKAAQGALGIYITVRASKAQRRARPVSGDPYYWRWVEGGHKIVPRLSKAQSGFSNLRKRAAGISITQRRRRATGMVKPYPFMGPAFRAQGDQARRIFEQAVIERIAKANRRK